MMRQALRIVCVGCFYGHGGLRVPRYVGAVLGGVHVLSSRCEDCGCHVGVTAGDYETVRIGPLPAARSAS